MLIAPGVIPGRCPGVVLPVPYGVRLPRTAGEAIGVPGTGSLKCSLNHFMSRLSVSWFCLRNLNPSGVTDTNSCRALLRGQ